MSYVKINNSPVTTVILAGGLGSRMGGNKGLQVLHGRTLIAWVLERVSRDSHEVFINVNSALEAYTPLGCRIITDEMPDWQGPLAGLHAALKCVQTEYVLTVPCDTPFLPDDLIARLLHAQGSDASEAAVAVVEGQRQPTVVLYNKNVLPKLLAYLGTGKRKVNDWLNTLKLSEVVFDHAKAFENINTRDELAQANQIAM